MYALKPLSLELWKCGNVPVENIRVTGMYIEFQLSAMKLY